MLTRKKFIAITSLGALSTLFPNYLFSSNLKVKNIDDLNVLLKQAAGYRKAGKFFKARNIYNQIIDSNPLEIRAYDGIRKIILAKGKQESDVIKLYKDALSLHPGNARIKERLFKEYFKAAIGNKRVSTTVNLGKRTLLDVKEKFENFLQNHPDKKNISKQLERINRMIDSNIDTNLDARKNSKLKTFKKQQRKLHKARFDSLSTDKVNEKLTKLLSKPISVDRKRHIRELNKIYVQRLRKEKNYLLALDKALAFYQLDKTDSLPLKMVRDLAKHTRSYDLLVSVERENHSLKNNFWSACTLFDALIRKHEFQRTTLNTEVESLLIFITNQINEPSHIFEAMTRKVKLLIIRNDLENAKVSLLELLKSKWGISSAHIIDRVNVLVAKYYKKINDVEKMNKVLGIAMHPNLFKDETDDLLSSVVSLNINRSTKKPIHIENLQTIFNKLN